MLHPWPVRVATMNEDAATPKKSKIDHLRDAFALEHNVVAASAAVFLFSLGEELWKKYLPKYLESLGAGTAIIGLFGTVKDFFDAVYQYPGGWLADRVGRRRAFLLFISLASVGYLIYLFSHSWPLMFVGLAFAMAWSSMASPAIFAVIGDALPRQKRAMGFTFQSLIKRAPMTVAPLIGGAMIAASGIQSGVRLGLVITLVLAAVTVLIVSTIRIPIAPGEPVNIRGVWRGFHRALKRLLISDIIIRMCEGLSDVFIILYVTDIVGVSVPLYGVLVAVQLATSIVVYFPAAKMADRFGRKPFVVATFIFFSVFPLAIALSHSFKALVIAFVIGGLRELGEPARKAMIVDLADQTRRGRTVGLYYLIRSLSITPAAVIGGLLWKINPAIPFFAACAIGLAGTLIFMLTVERGYAA